MISISRPARRSSLRQSLRHLAAASCAACLLSPVTAAPADATPQTILRGLSHIALAPLDIALAPVTSFIGIYRNMQDIDDSLGVRLAYLIPGYAWNVGVQIWAGAIREIAGLLELVPGFFLVPFEVDMTPLFAPGEKANALVDIETPPLNIKFGIDYTSVPY